MVKHEVMNFDVLVLGGGGAGARAAIEAHREGANVAIITKGNFPAGCTTISMGAMCAACESRDNPDLHLKDTLKGGAFLNDYRLVKVMVDEALDRTYDLETFGTQFQKGPSGFKPFPMSGSKYPRGVFASDPYMGGFIKGLAAEVKKRGISIMEHVHITSLIKRNNTVVGAVGLNLQDGAFLTLGAKATVLTMGGAGNLYPLTTNPEDVTGDGYALAFRAGAVLKDMEFIQSRVCMIKPVKLRGMPPPADGLNTLGGRFYNSQGERYMKKYYPELEERVTRDNIAICATREIKAGKGTASGGVYCDLSGVPRNQLTQFKRFMDACKSESIDPTWQPIEWAPGVHHIMGGIVINEKCETSLSGLYAAGEVSAGVHGANRVAGNALTETQVFGRRAGAFSAMRATSMPDFTIEEGDSIPEREKILRLFERKKGVDYSALRKRIQSIMGQYGGVVRKGDELKTAVEQLDQISKYQLPRLCLKGEKNYKAFAKLLETINMALVGEMVLKSALMRTETRGAHFREDYPKQDDHVWLGNITVRLQNNRMELDFTRKSLPEHFDMD